VASGVRQLTRAEIESLREDSRLALVIGRVLLVIKRAETRGASAAEIQTLQTKLKSLENRIESLN
jgi:chaperonin cofactor prefoldin